MDALLPGAAKPLTREERVLARRQRVESKIAAKKEADATGGDVPAARPPADDGRPSDGAPREARAGVAGAKAGSDALVSDALQQGAEAAEKRRARERAKRQALRRAADDESRAFAPQPPAFVASLAPLLDKSAPVDPRALADALDERRAALKAMLRGKERLLGEAALLVRGADDECVRQLTASAAQVDALLQAMAQQAADVEAACERELAAAEASLSSARGALLARRREEFDAMLARRSDAEAAFIQRGLDAADARHEALRALHEAAADEHADLAARLEGDVHGLELQLGDAHASLGWAEDRLAYNHAVLGRRGRERAGVLAAAKRRTRRLQDALLKLKARCLALDRRSLEASLRLGDEHRRVAGQLADLRAKFRRTEAADAAKRRKMWAMKCEALSALATRLLEYDRLISERLLHQAWAPPPLPLPLPSAPSVLPLPSASAEGRSSLPAQPPCSTSASQPNDVGGDSGGGGWRGSEQSAGTSTAAAAAAAQWEGDGALMGSDAAGTERKGGGEEGCSSSSSSSSSSTELDAIIAAPTSRALLRVLVDAAGFLLVDDASGGSSTSSGGSSSGGTPQQPQRSPAVDGQAECSGSGSSGGGDGSGSLDEDELALLQRGRRVLTALNVTDARAFAALARLLCADPSAPAPTGEFWASPAAAAPTLAAQTSTEAGCGDGGCSDGSPALTTPRFCAPDEAVRRLRAFLAPASAPSSRAPHPQRQQPPPSASGDVAVTASSSGSGGGDIGRGRGGATGAAVASALAVADGERAYFDALAGVVSDERHEVWRLLRDGMRAYQGCVQARQELAQQAAELERENAGLRAMAQQALAAARTMGLQVPEEARVAARRLGVPGA